MKTPPRSQETSQERPDAADRRDPSRLSRNGTTASPIQSAEYIADLAAELAEMARGSKLDLLAYLLDIVRLEAETAARKLLEVPR